MEVISFVGSSTAVRKRVNYSDRKVNFSLNQKKADPQTTISIFDFIGRPGKRTYENPLKKIPLLINTVKSVDVSGITFYFPLVLVALIAVFVFAGVFSGLTYLESHTSPLKFDVSATSELESLDSAMSKFAMESLVSDVDENGNVLAADGSVLTAASVGVGQAVTFKDYKVGAGDSISTITRKFGLSNISTLIAVNNIGNVRTLRAGQKLRIPSQDGLVYRVNAGDSLNAISVRYHVSVEEILDANDLTTDVLSRGMELFIPGAKMDSASLKKAMGELFICPITAGWRLTSYFGPRKDPFTGAASNHTGIDMACSQGTKIRAAMSGKVVYVGWSNVFGNYVIINHGNGYQSLYAHMLKTLVKNGQSVDQTTNIGLVGSTGYSTGPHLHFTVYKAGKLVDPLSLIKR